MTTSQENVETAPPRCYGGCLLKNFAQEIYETSTGDARRRAGELYAAGYKIVRDSWGIGHTPIGDVHMTMLSISPGRHEDLGEMPKANRVDFS